MSGEAWFSALGEPLDKAEQADIAGYLAGLGMRALVCPVTSWQEAAEACARPAEPWWDAEEAHRTRLEALAKLDPANPEWLALNEALHGAAAVAADASMPR